MGTTKHTYTLLFRGDLVQEFTSVYDEQAVLLGYRRFPAPGESHLMIPTGRVASRPEVLRKMKTLAALKRSGGAGPRWTTYPDQTFMVTVRPGVTELTEMD